MVTSEELQAFISSIPPMPEVLQKTIAAVEEGELIKAANIAAEDIALSTYLRNFVNKPIFYFPNEVKDIKQIFGILGLAKAKELLYHYMMHLFSPKRWQLFDLNERSFNDLQIFLSNQWKIILEHLNIKDKDVTAVISLLPASIIVTELIFSKHIEQVQLLKETKNIDYNTILERLVGVNLFDIAQMIGESWELNKTSLKVMMASSGTKQCKESTLCTLAKYMHMLLFYTLSQAEYVECGLNDFLDFHPEFIQAIMDDFYSLVNLS